MSRSRARSRRNAYLAAVAVAVSGALLVLALGLYPIALVNGSPVWASSFRAYVGSALAYQQAVRDTYVSTSSALLAASLEGEQQLGAAALDELVEQKLIEQGIARLAGENADDLVQTKLDALLKEPDLPGASRALFQLDPDAFVRAILRPQAEREVLTGRIYLDSQTLEAWVAQARAEAQVRVLSSSYGWEAGRVRAR